MNAAREARPRADIEAEFAARYETVLHGAERTGDLARLERLLQHATKVLGSYNGITLNIECGLEELRSRCRPLTESVEVWDALMGRAETVLPADDPTRMSIAAFRARYRRWRGRRADLEAGVESYRRQWEQRRGTLGEDHFRTRVMRANLALAIRDRDGDGDLDEALRMLREEVEHRDTCYGTGDPFTWIARSGLAGTLVRAAERATDPARRHELAREAKEIASSLADGRRIRFGRADASTLRAQLVHAHALILLGSASEAVGQILYVRSVAEREHVPLKWGWAETLLAQAKAAAGEPAEALRWAEKAYRLKADHFPPDSRQVAEAERLRDEFRGRLRAGASAIP